MLSEKNYLNNIGRVLAVLALSGAIASAQYVGNMLAWAGITYYLICIAAIIFKHPWARYITWAAVGFHIVLVSYSLWNWFTASIPPCQYCFIAAGLAFFAATALQKVPMAVFPVILMTAVWLSWPYAFAMEDYSSIPTEEPTTTSDAQLEETIQAGNSEPPADGDTGTSVPVDSPVSSSVSSTGNSSTIKQTVTAPPKKTAVQPVETGANTGAGAAQSDDNTQPDNTTGDNDGTKPDIGGSDKPAKPQPP
ncbi:MAG: hypothetical protein PHD36_02365 [Desulfotomaculaceae bacterium]|nr:hypothetical protein [Desulfotomaculaceae bacterium]